MEKIEQAKHKKQVKKRNRFIFRSAILIVLFGALVFAIVSNLTAEEDAAVDINEQAPDFQLDRVANNEDEIDSSLQLSDLEGKGVMLNFWATYCEPCEREMPYMEELYPKYKEQGVEIVAVSVDATELVINKFVDHYNLSFPILHDKDSQVLDAYGIRPLPTTYFIDENGVVVDRVLGELSLERLEGYLQEIVPKGT
ncbi:thiol-disulfide oxidoreductase ResA [Gracilibacillus thailandensis]|jgi:peroxiredoxin|uniref:Thiol-disulfide oxidoreductase ResA n=1 Tax=Gracilibacillus thailandensis TaxID=563735 RepID=A0A6N7R5Z7_9BACI|nr:thiol-disulfide oxidoreductase ResA [Gracilibacillus thailandensis]MRI68667.1 thiol-disulfide oxidoreductase ResA [Gracilibacillus thailandensis]